MSDTQNLSLNDLVNKLNPSYKVHNFQDLNKKFADKMIQDYKLDVENCEKDYKHIHQDVSSKRYNNTSVGFFSYRSLKRFVAPRLNPDSPEVNDFLHRFDDIRLVMPNRVHSKHLINRDYFYYLPMMCEKIFNNPEFHNEYQALTDRIITKTHAIIKKAEQEAIKAATDLSKFSAQFVNEEHVLTVLNDNVSIRQRVNNLRHECTNYDEGIRECNKLTDTASARRAFTEVGNKVFSLLLNTFPQYANEIKRQWKQHSTRYAIFAN